MKKYFVGIAAIAAIAVLTLTITPAAPIITGSDYVAYAEEWPAVTPIPAPVIITTTQAEKGDDFPGYWEFDVTMVEAVQTRLNTYGFPVNVDGKFGPATAQALKEWQLVYDQPVTGVVDDDVAALMGVENWPRGSTMYYMADLTKARHTYVVYVALGGRSRTPHLGLFYNGQLIAESACITGAQDKGFFTPVGVHGVSKKSSIRTGDGYVYYNQTWLKVGGKASQIAVHSLLHANDGSLVPGQRLGTQSSEGCVRVPDDLAAWLNSHLPSDNTDIVIDDRAWSPASTGYTGLFE